MDLFLIRHTNAEDRTDFALTGQDDRLRPVSEKGQRRMENVSPNFKKLVPELSVIATSPLVRAHQTVEILRRWYPETDVEEIPELVPEGSVKPFLKYLKARRGLTSIAAVGHEPHISALACWLLSAQDHTFCYFKKAGIMHLEFSGDVVAGGAELIGYYPPKLFKTLDLAKLK